MTDIGFVRNGFNGPISLVHGDILDWAKLSRRNISPRMGQLLINLSRAYVTQARKSHGDVPAPWGDEEYTIFIAQARVDVKTRKALRNRKNG